MGTMLNPMDFQQARVKQVLFKSKLRSVLYGVREAEPALFSLAENGLAEWLRTVARPAFPLHPLVGQLEQELQRMLSTGQDLVRQQQSGQLEEARAGLERIDAHAARIETLLTNLQETEQ